MDDVSVSRVTAICMNSVGLLTCGFGADQACHVMASLGVSFFGCFLAHDILQAAVNQAALAATIRFLQTSSFCSTLRSCFVPSPQAMAGKGEAKLVDVILNKYYGGDAKSLPDAELLTAYIIRELNCLMATDEKHVLSGDIKFSEALQRLALPQEAPTAAEAATEKDGSAADLMGPAGIETLAAAVPAK